MSRTQYTGIERVVTDDEIGPLSDDQMRQLFSSGWRFNPSSITWHKLYVADSGNPEIPAFVAEKL